jgi:hypothetical protein
MITEFYAHGMQADTVHMPISATSKPRGVQIQETYETRSCRNIRSWREFLPEDCVAAMISMGWDLTT